MLKEKCEILKNEIKWMSIPLLKTGRLGNLLFYSLQGKLLML